MNTAANASMNAGPIDIVAVARRAYATFAARPITHVAAAAIVVGASVLTVGVLAGPLTVGYLLLIDAQLDGGDVRLDQLWGGFELFSSALITWLLLTGATLTASVFVVLPGLVVALLGGFSFWFVAHRQASPIVALKASWSLTRRHLGSVLLLLVVAVGLNFLGLLVVIGPLITLPLATIMASITFRQLAS